MSAARVPGRHSWRVRILVPVACCALSVRCGTDAVLRPFAPPTLAGLSAEAAVQGTTVRLTATGTGFVRNATRVEVAGGGVAVTNVAVASETSLTADVAVAADAALGERAVRVGTVGGDSEARTLVILPPVPVATAVAPVSGARGSDATVVVTGAHFVPGATSVAVGGGDVEAVDVEVTSPTALTAVLRIGAAAAMGERALTVTTAGGTSGGVAFVVRPRAPVLAALGAPRGMRGGTVSQRLTGTDFEADAVVTVSGTGVAVTDAVVEGPTAIRATFVVAPDAELGARDVSVATWGGASAALAFMVDPPPPTLTGLARGSAAPGATVAQTLTGTDFVPGATTVAVSGGGVTVSAVSVTGATSATATFAVDGAAEIGPRQVTVTTAGGTSAPLPFTVASDPPELTGIEPAQAVQGSTVAVTLSGTGLDAGATVAVSGTGVTVTGVGIAGSAAGASAAASSLTATFAIAADAAPGAREVTVTTAGGTSAPATFTVLPPPPTLTGSTPASGTQASSVAVTLTGTHFVAGATTVAVSGAGVTATDVAVTSPTSLSATLVIAAGAATGERQLSVTTAGGTSAGRPFTVLAQAPYLTAISPATGIQAGSVDVTLTGSGFVAGATTVAVSGVAVAVGAVEVREPGRLTVRFILYDHAIPGARQVTVTTAGGTTNALTFTVLPKLRINSFAASATQLTTAQPTILSWTTTEATSCSIDNGVGSVSCTGTSTVTPGSSKTYTLTANGPQGTVTATTSVTAGQAGRYAYVADGTANNIHMFTINSGTGALTSIGTATGGLNEPEAIAVDPAGRYLYVANRQSDQVAAFTIASGTGHLTANGTVATGTTPAGVAVDPTGRYVYVTGSASGTVHAYTIGTDGRLTANGGSVAAGAQPYGITVDPTGRYVFVADASSGPNNVVRAYTIQSNGTLVANGTVTVGLNPVAVAADPTGKWVYVGVRGDQEIRRLDIASDGTLTSGATIAVGSEVNGAIVDPTGAYAYFGVGGAADDIFQYTITAGTGALVANTPASVNAGDNPSFLAIDPAGDFLYAVGIDGLVYMFSIGSNGTLSTIGGGTVSVADARGIAVSR